MKNNIDEIFKKNLGNVEVPPASHIKMGLAKQVSTMILKKTLLYVSIISTSTIALAVTGKLLYDTYTTEKHNNEINNENSTLVIEEPKAEENFQANYTVEQKTIHAEYEYLTAGESSLETAFLTSVYNTADKCVDIISEELVPLEIQPQDQISETNSPNTVPERITKTYNSDHTDKKEPITDDSYLDELTLMLLSNGQSLQELEENHNRELSNIYQENSTIPISDDSSGKEQMNIVQKIDQENEHENHLQIEEEKEIEETGKLALQRETYNIHSPNGNSTYDLSSINVSEAITEKSAMIDVSILTDVPLKYDLLDSGIEGKKLVNVVPNEYKSLYSGWLISLYGGIAGLSELGTPLTQNENATDQRINESFSLKSTGFMVGKKLGKFTISSGLGFQELNQGILTERDVIHITETVELVDVYETVLIGGVSTEVLVGQDEIVTSEETVLREEKKHETMFQYYTLPINTEFNMLETPRVDLGFKAGVSYSKLARAKGTIYDLETSSFMSIDKKSDLINKGFWSAKMGISISTALTKRVYLQIDPSVLTIRNGVQKGQNTKGFSHSGMEMQVGLLIKL